MNSSRGPVRPTWCYQEMGWTRRVRCGSYTEWTRQKRRRWLRSLLEPQIP